ncbi:MAG: hypothetical protein ACPLYD_11575 [Anaerolineae bacterium]
MAGKRSSRGWFRSLQHWFRRVQWWYWRHADNWPLSALRRYRKALFVLTLWLLTAIGLFRLILYLLSNTLSVPLVEGEAGMPKETIALLGSLLTALIGFSLQQWKSEEEEEGRKQEQIQQALCEVQALAELLRKDPSEGARRYSREYLKKGGIWQSGRVRAALEEAWDKAPVELQRFIAIVDNLPEGRTLGEKEATQALLWAYESLDEEWQAEAAEVCWKRGLSIPEWEKREWQAVIGIWPEVRLDRSPPAPGDDELLQGIRFLGLKTNPFGAEKAEFQPTLPETIALPSWWEKVRQGQRGLFITVPGGGRTTVTLYLSREMLRRREAFPFYWRVTLQGGSTGDDLLADMMRIVAMTLARYIAVRPGSFVSATPSRKAAMTRLFFANLDAPLLYLRQAGLLSIGQGMAVQEAIAAYAEALDIPASLSEWENLDLLGRAVPHGFPRLWVLADVQGEASEDHARTLYGLAETLDRFGVILQVFLGTSAPDRWGSYGEICRWSKGDLSQILSRRLQVLLGDETLNAWCDLRAWEGSAAEERLIGAADGSPAHLIRLGNELLRHIGRNQRRLRPEDMNQILGGSREVGEYGAGTIH